MPHLPDVSVIIPTYNRSESLLRTLDSLRRQTYPVDRFEVIVVDDGSTDDTAQVTDCEWPFRLKYRYQENQGIAVARNWAVSHCTSEYVAFLDDDILINRAYLEALLSLFSAQTSGAIVMATLVSPPNMEDTSFHRLYIGRDSRTKSTSNSRWELAPIPFYKCTGGAIAMRRRDYLDLGGMEALPGKAKTSWGGLDLAYRAYRCDFNFYRVPGARAVHYDYAISDLDTYVERMYRVGRFAVLLLQKYPELEHLVPLFRDRTAAQIGDSLAVMLRKSLRTVTNSRAARSLFFTLIDHLEGRNVPDFVLWKLYVWVVSSSVTIGMRDGVAEFGSWKRNR